MTIIVNFNSQPSLDTSIGSVLAQEVTGEHHVVVWENGSDEKIDGVAIGEAREINGKWLHHVGYNRNLGYAPGVQESWQWVRRQSWCKAVSHIHLANPDTRAGSSRVLKILCDSASTVGGLAGPVMRNIQGDLRPSSYPLLRPYLIPLTCLERGWMTRLTKLRGSQPSSGYVGALDGAYLVFSRPAWDDLKGLDPNYFLYTDDQDVCWRAHARGIRRWRESSAEVIHEGGTSRRQRRVLCQLEKIRCGLRYAELHFGRAQTLALRKILMIEFLSVHGKNLGLSWWAQNCPISFSNGNANTSIEDQYMSWFRQNKEAESRRIGLALRKELDG